MKFVDKNFKLNIPIKEFRISIMGDENEIKNLTNEMDGNFEQVDNEIRFFDLENFTLINLMMLRTKYRKINFTKVFDYNNNKIGFAPM